MPQDKSAPITGRVFDIQHFSTHDGPGVRTTVFLKGCPLSCRWCSNPESQSPRPQILYHRQLCRGCGACLDACDKKAIAVMHDELAYDRSRCWGCGACARVCPHEARTLSGRLMTVDEVCRDVRQDWRTYMHSGGGVTFGGGEALMQPEFLSALLDRLHGELGYHTCLDTCAHAPWPVLEALLDRLDCILLDVKHVDPERHAAMTGADNAHILENARRLGARGFPVLVRVPLIPGFNDDPVSLEGLGTFLAEAGLKDVELMPYHAYGRGKYAALDREYPMAGAITPDPARAVAVLRSFGLAVEVR